MTTEPNTPEGDDIESEIREVADIGLQRGDTYLHERLTWIADRLAVFRHSLFSSKENDEAYELGKRDGYEKAIQDLDIATGGDGEFFGSSDNGETVDMPVMRERIIDRLAPPCALPGRKSFESWIRSQEDLSNSALEWDGDGYLNKTVDWMYRAHVSNEPGSA